MRKLRLILPVQNIAVVGEAGRTCLTIERFTTIIYRTDYIL